MPRLLVFALCEKVIIGQDNMPSLIGVLQGFNINVPAGKTMTDTGFFPCPWAAFSSWLNEGDDATVMYEQLVSLLGSSGKLLFFNVTQFQMTKIQHRISVGSPVFPTLPEGSHNVLLAIRKVGDPEWTQVSSYPLQIYHIVIPSPAAVLEPEKKS